MSSQTSTGLETSERLTGGPFNQLTKLIRRVGYNKDVDIELGTVTSPPPALKIKIDNMPVELEASELIVAQHLTKYTRNVTIRNTGSTSLTSQSVSAIMNPSASFTELDISSGNFTLTSGYIDYLDELKNGDRVIVASANEGQLYFVLDRAVNYNGG